jgi:amino-acid N-acetyltransferase
MWMRSRLLRLSEEGSMTMSSQSAVASIRRSTIADRQAIEALLVEAGLPTAGVGELLTANSSSFLVAETSSGARELVGVAGLEVRGDSALLRSVAVRPEWRSRGVGQELVARIASEAEAQGIHALYLLTLTAERYFPRFGFERVQRSEVPLEIAETVEFKSACPSTATAMMKQFS